MHSARSALLTIISLFVYPEPRPVPTAVFLHVLELLGFDSKAGRQALHRAAAAGWIESQKSGRRAFWQMTPAGYRLMIDGEKRLRMLGDRDREWDGRFVVLHASVPDVNRALRHTLRTRLAWLGFGVMSPGTWINIRLTAEREAADLMRQLELKDSTSYLATPGLIGDFRQVVERAWDLKAVAAEYRTFIDEFAALRPDAGDQAVVALVQIVHRWRRFPFIDPSLPGVLLPRDWVGTEASQTYLSLSSLWMPAGLARWRELVADAEEGRQLAS